MVVSVSRKPHSVFQWLMAGVVLLSGSFSGVSHAQSGRELQWSESAKPLTIFQPGDAVRIQIWELYQEESRRNLNLSGDYPINPEGFVIMPVIGEVRVKGLTVYELIQSLQEKLRAYLRDPLVYVRPLIRVTMQGEFNRPGSYRVDPSSSLWDLVALAGGPTAYCNLERMRMERGGEIVIKRLLESFERAYSLEEVGIESGDQIIAPPRGGVDVRTLIAVINLLTSLLLLYFRVRTGRW